MLDAAEYSAVERRRDGRAVEIRALRPDDRSGLIAAFNQTSTQSRYRRFFAVRRGFTEQEIAFYVNVDFIKHVALVAVIDDGGQPTIIGGGRYIVVQPGKAELAFAVVDEHQGQGIGAALMRHLLVIARGAGLEELIADVLPDNVAMRKVLEKSGFRATPKHDPQAMQLALRLA